MSIPSRENSFGKAQPLPIQAPKGVVRSIDADMERGVQQAQKFTPRLGLPVPVGVLAPIPVAVAPVVVPVPKVEPLPQEPQYRLLKPLSVKETFSAMSGPVHLTPAETAKRLQILQNIESELVADFEYFKRQGFNKLYLTELYNCIFSINHQAFNILITDYFDKKFTQEISEIVKVEKSVFFRMRPDREIIEYINNEFELCSELEKEIAELQLKLNDVLKFIGETKAERLLIPEMLEENAALLNPTKMEFLHEKERVKGIRPPTEYEAKVEVLRTFCRNIVQHGLQSARWQEFSKEKFEKIVEDLKEAEFADYEMKEIRRNVLRAYKDTLSRVKNRIKNLYTKRFEKDLHAFKIGDLALLDLCAHFKTHGNEFINSLKDKEFLLKNIDFKENIVRFYNEPTYKYNTDEDLYFYNPEWPPFREQILDPAIFYDQGSKAKLFHSFEKLLTSFEKVINIHDKGIDPYYFETVDGTLNKINNMVLFLLDRLGPLKLTPEVKKLNDSHQMTVMYIDHYELIMRRIKEIYHDDACEGPLRVYLRKMFERNQENEIKQKIISEPFKEIMARFELNRNAYHTQEFWADLSMRLYRFSQKFFSETTDNNFIQSFIQSLNLVQENINFIYKEIIDFNAKQMMQGFLNDIEIKIPKDIQKKIGVNEVKDFLNERHVTREGMIVEEALQQYIQEDNADYDNYLHTKYLDARQKILEVYMANKFNELFRIDPINNFTRVTFTDTQEEYYLNIPVYFQTKVEEVKIVKPPPFVYVRFPPGDPKKVPLVHVIEDEPLKVEIDREFKYLKQNPDELKWQQIYTKFFDKLTLEQFINLLFRRRVIIHQGRYYEYVDQITLTMPEGAAITKERAAQVSSIEDSIAKGFGYSKYSLGSKRKLPFPIPFSSGEINADTIISCYLLSPKHLINFSKTSSEGIPGSDAFFVVTATDIIEQTNGVEVKWSVAIEWIKSSMIKPILESKVPDEAKKSVMDWATVAEEVIRTNKPEEEVKKPDVVELDIEMANYRENPVFLKKVEALNFKAAQEAEEEYRHRSAAEQFKVNFQFEKAKEKAIAYGANAALAKGVNESMTSWDIIPPRLKKANPEEIDKVEINSFDGLEYVEKVNELDDSEKRKAYIAMGIFVVALILKAFVL